MKGSDLKHRDSFLLSCKNLCIKGNIDSDGLNIIVKNAIQEMHITFRDYTKWPTQGIKITNNTNYNVIFHYQSHHQVEENFYTVQSKSVSNILLKYRFIVAYQELDDADSIPVTNSEQKCFAVICKLFNCCCLSFGESEECLGDAYLELPWRDEY